MKKFSERFEELVPKGQWKFSRQMREAILRMVDRDMAQVPDEKKEQVFGFVIYFTPKIQWCTKPKARWKGLFRAATKGVLE